MGTSDWMHIIEAIVALVVMPLIATLYASLNIRFNAFEEKSLTKEVFRAHMRRLDESNERIERAMGILPRVRTRAVETETEEGD